MNNNDDDNNNNISNNKHSLRSNTKAQFSLQAASPETL
jgi:hypothetical protein